MLRWGEITFFIFKEENKQKIDADARAINKNQETGLKQRFKLNINEIQTQSLLKSKTFSWLFQNSLKKS